jgi:predicted SprT family Zn-dependent metalloprotease
MIIRHGGRKETKMREDQARRLASTEMERCGLEGWRFGFDNGRNRYGQCTQSRRLITLSRLYVAVATDEDIRLVILHEIAHALQPDPYESHGANWRRTCLEIGGDGKAKHDSRYLAQMARYWIYCPEDGGHVIGYRHAMRRGDVWRCRTHAVVAHAYEAGKVPKVPPATREVAPVDSDAALQRALDSIAKRRDRRGW